MENTVRKKKDESFSKIIQVRMTPTMYRKLCKIAISQGLEASTFVREVVVNYMNIITTFDTKEKVELMNLISEQICHKIALRAKNFLKYEQERGE